MFPPDPSSTLTLFAQLMVTIGEVAALSLIRLTKLAPPHKLDAALANHSSPRMSCQRRSRNKKTPGYQTFALSIP